MLSRTDSSCIHGSLMWRRKFENVRVSYCVSVCTEVAFIPHRCSASTLYSIGFLAVVFVVLSYQVSCFKIPCPVW